MSVCAQIVAASKKKLFPCVKRISTVHSDFVKACKDTTRTNLALTGTLCLSVVTLILLYRTLPVLLEPLAFLQVTLCSQPLDATLFVAAVLLLTAQFLRQLHCDEMLEML